jgi:hypothetical protein
MKQDADLVPEGKTVIDGIAGESLVPGVDTVPAQAGITGHKSDRLDTVTEAPPARSDSETEAVETSSAVDVLEIIDGTREDNLTNETVAEKAMER